MKVLLFICVILCLVLNVNCKMFVIECKVFSGNNACIDNIKLDALRNDKITALKVTFYVKKAKLGEGGFGTVHLVNVHKFEYVNSRISAQYLDLSNGAATRYFKKIWFDDLILKERSKRSYSGKKDDTETPVPDEKSAKYLSPTERVHWHIREAARLKANAAFNDLINEFRTTLEVQNKIRALRGKPKSLVVEVLMLDEENSLYVMEALDKTLGDAISPDEAYGDAEYQGQNYKTKKKEVPLKTALELYQKAFKALAQLHQLGYGHNDAKSDNFMLTKVSDPNKKPDVKILDFGKTRLDNEGVRKKCWNSRSKSWKGATTSQIKKYRMSRTDDCWGDMAHKFPPELHLGKYPTFKWSFAHVDMWYLSLDLFADIAGWAYKGGLQDHQPVHPFATMLSKENNKLVWIQPDARVIVPLILKMCALNNPNPTDRNSGIKFAKRSLISFMDPGINELNNLFTHLFNVHIQFRPRSATQVIRRIGAAMRSAGDNPNNDVTIRLKDPANMRLPRLLRRAGKNVQMTLVQCRNIKVPAIKLDKADMTRSSISISIPLVYFNVLVSKNYDLNVQKVYNDRVAKFETDKETNKLHPHVQQKLSKERAKMTSKVDNDQRQHTLHSAYNTCRSHCLKFCRSWKTHTSSKSIITLKRRLRDRERQRQVQLEVQAARNKYIEKFCSKGSGVLKTYPSVKDCQTISRKVDQTINNAIEEAQRAGKQDADVSFDKFCEPQPNQSAICDTGYIKSQVTKLSWSTKHKLKDGTKIIQKVKVKF